jgi:hypothetical protein
MISLVVDSALHFLSRSYVVVGSYSMDVCVMVVVVVSHSQCLVVVAATTLSKPVFVPNIDHRTIHYPPKPQNVYLVWSIPVDMSHDDDYYFYYHYYYYYYSYDSSGDCWRLVVLVQHHY